MTYTDSHLQVRFDALPDAAGLTATVDPDQLTRSDRCHVEGADPVDRLIPALGLGPGAACWTSLRLRWVPPRRVAQHTGAHVVGLDITAAYVDVDVAVTLTARCGRQDLVAFQDTGITGPGRADPFDAAPPCTS